MLQPKPAEDWISIPHRPYMVSLLKDDYNKDDCEDLNADLMPHQKLALKAMRDLEMEKSLSVTFGNNVDRAETRCGVYSDKYGSGKTFVIMALLCGNPPTKLPDLIRYYPSIKNDLVSTVKFAIQPNTNLIFVGSSVLAQWEDHLKRFTSLKVLRISGYLNFKKFYGKFKSNPLGFLNQYDVVLIKNGTMNSKHFANDCSELTETPLMERQLKSIISVMFELSMHFSVQWLRVIVDDFDVIQVHKNSQLIPACFTWFISASRKTNDSVAPDRKITNIVHNIAYARPTYLSAASDKFLFKTFNIRNNGSYIDKCIGICPPIGFKYTAVNPNKKIIKMIGSLIENVGGIMDMLNSGAIKTASESIGITATSEIEIFKQLLGQSYAKYVKLSAELDKFNQVSDQIKELPLSEKNISIPRIIQHIKDDTPFKYNFENLQTYLDEKIEELEAKKLEVGRPINRVIDNIKDGSCPICFGKISDCKNESDDEFSSSEDSEETPETKEDAIVMKCCNIIICSKCLFESTKMRGTNHDIVGSCPNCRKKISYKKDTLYLSKDLGIEQLLEDSFSLSKLDKEKPPELEQKPKPEPEPEPLAKKNSKLDILASILLRDGRYKSTPHQFSFKSLLSGKGKLPLPGERRLKTVIYSKYDESLQKISEHLDALGFTHVELSGGSKKLENAVREFKKDIDIILINGEKYSAGLNLQFADQLIFMHRFTLNGASIDVSIEEQIVGRLQRLGRKTQLLVHYIVYEDEL